MHKRRLRSALLLFLLLTGFTACSSRPGSRTPEEINEQNFPERIMEFNINERVVKNNVYLKGEDVGGLKESEVLAGIRNHAVKIDKEAKDASLDSNTWQVIPGKTGRKVNVERTLDLVLNAEEGRNVDLIIEEVMPLITSDMLAKNIVVIGSYTTPLLNKGESRVNNIQLASEKIDCIKLAPGDEFSFNRIVGKRTEAKGYEEAPIIIRTKDGPKKDYGVGGGVCQVSTTIYNAVEECGLEILERHIHSKNVGYVPRGEDATVSYGSADLRFRNNRNYPVMIRVYPGKKTLTVKIIENRNQL